MTTLWSCPDPDCPPIEIEPKDVEEPGGRTYARSAFKHVEG
jgi:hypothetical protein